MVTYEIWMKPRIRLSALLLVLGLTVPLFVLPSSLQGRVINHETTAGIEGVFVYARWFHSWSDGYGSRNSCPQASVVTTDANGAYSLPSGPLGLEPDILAYKPGLEEILDLATDAPRGGQIHRMAPLSSPSRRERDFVGIHHISACKIPHMRDVLTPLYRAADEEAAKLGIKGDFVKSLRFVDDEPDMKKGAR